jgi:protein SCO1/2
MNRRTYLRGLAASGLTATAATAGCSSLTSLGESGGNETTVLDPPDTESDVDPEDLPYPAYGQQIPDVNLPSILHDGEESTTGYETPIALTFIYTTCRTACPVLTQALRRAHNLAKQEEWAENTNFVEISFDPERDTPEALRTYADERSVDVDSGRWHLLRPESYDRAQQVVSDQFGVAFQKSTSEDMDQYMFTHFSLVLLVNGDNYVERAYNDGQKANQQLPEDMKRVVSG